MDAAVPFPQELRPMRPYVDTYLNSKLRQFGTILLRQLNVNLPPEHIRRHIDDALYTMAQHDAAAAPQRALRLVIRHDCQSSGCGDVGCVLCQYNPSRLCTRNVKQKYLIDDHLKAKCGAPLRVELVDDSGAAHTEGLPAGVQLEMHVLNGEKYKELCPDNTLLSLGAIRNCIISHHTKALLRREGMGDDQLRVFLPLERGAAAVSDLALTTSSEALLSGKAPTFRLLVWAVEANGEPVPYVTYVVSESFVVATKRVKHAIKSDIPSVGDHISKLLHIGKATVDKLTDLRAAFQEEGFDVKLPESLARVEKVGQFRQLVEMSEASNDLKNKLRHVLKLSPEKWDEVCQHALSAVVPDFRNRVWWCAQLRLGLLYGCKNGAILMDNPMAIVRAPATPDGQATVVPLQNLSPNEFNAIPKLKQQALQAWYMPNHPNWQIYEGGAEDSGGGGGGGMVALPPPTAPPGAASPGPPGGGALGGMLGGGAAAGGLLVPPVAAAAGPYGLAGGGGAGPYGAPADPYNAGSPYLQDGGAGGGGGPGGAYGLGGDPHGQLLPMGAGGGGAGMLGAGLLGAPAAPRVSNSSPFLMLQQPGAPPGAAAATAQVAAAVQHPGAAAGMAGGPGGAGRGAHSATAAAAAAAQQQHAQLHGLQHPGGGGSGSGSALAAASGGSVGSAGRSPFAADVLMNNIADAFPRFPGAPQAGAGAGGHAAAAAGAAQHARGQPEPHPGPHGGPAHAGGAGGGPTQVPGSLVFPGGGGGGTLGMPGLDTLKTEEIMDRGMSIFGLQSLTANETFRSNDWLAQLGPAGAPMHAAQQQQQQLQQQAHAAAVQQELAGTNSYTMIDVSPPPGAAAGVGGGGVGHGQGGGGGRGGGEGGGFDPERRLSIKLNSMSLDLDKVIAEHAGS